MTNTAHQICRLLGSNILPETHIPQAIAQLGQRLAIARISSVWESHAVGSTGPNFLNAALLVYSQFHPRQLKAHLLRPLEAKMGRIRTTNKNAARPIDLDVVVFDGRPVDPDLWSYAHMAVPVAELLPEIAPSTGGATLQEAAWQLSQKTVITRRSDLILPVFFNKKTAESVQISFQIGSYLT
jgi:2-amino-4-hydroxy-6-hydroxymethyldihydropteridine diphosphokinase